MIPATLSGTPGHGARRTIDRSVMSTTWPATAYLFAGSIPQGSPPIGAIAAGGTGSSDQGTPSESDPPTCSRYAVLHSASVATTRHVHSRRDIAADGRRTRRDGGRCASPAHSIQGIRDTTSASRVTHRHTADSATIVVADAYGTVTVAGAGGVAVVAAGIPARPIRRSRRLTGRNDTPEMGEPQGARDAGVAPLYASDTRSEASRAESDGLALHEHLRARLAL